VYVCTTTTTHYNIPSRAHSPNQHNRLPLTKINNTGIPQEFLCEVRILKRKSPYTLEGGDSI
jgi:hypothetical protein